MDINLQETPRKVITQQDRIKLIANLLMSEPWTLVACGLGEITGEALARHLLSLAKPPQK